MSRLSLLAQVASNVDPNAIGVSITSLIGSLGAAGAAVAVTYYFLGFLRNEGEKQSRVFAEFRDYQSDSQKKFQDQLERLTDRQEQLQRTFQEQIARMTETQNALLRDAILAMKSVEKTLEASGQTMHGVEKSVTALHYAVNGIDDMVRRMIDASMVPKKSSPTPPVKETAT